MKTELTARQRIKLVIGTLGRPELVEATLANDDYRQLMESDPEIYNITNATRSPLTRAEFTHGTVIAQAGEALSVGLTKPWGEFRGFRPINQTDKLYVRRVSMVINPDAPWNKRIEQRKELKRRLPKETRKWVGVALAETQEHFLKLFPAADARVVERRLGIDAKQFWRVAKGRKEWRPANPEKQLELF